MPAMIRAIATVSCVMPTLALAQGTDAITGPRYLYVELPAPLGSSNNEAVDINASGAVTGVSSYQYAGRGTVWQNGTAIDLGTALGGPFAQSIGRRILDDGTVWGGSDFDSKKPGSAAFFRHGVWTSIGTGYPGPTSFSSVFGANSAGMVVGQRGPLVPPPNQYQKFRPQAFVWKNGRFTNITLGGRNGQAFAVNAGGVVVGYSQIPNRTPHAFKWQGGRVTDLGKLGVDPASQSQARRVNDSGDVVGFGVILPDRAYQAVVWRADGTVQALGFLSQAMKNSEATSINASGAVVGDSTTKSGVNHATIFVHNKLYDLNSTTTGIPKGLTLSSANAIGPDGTIIGTTCAAPSTCPPGSPQIKRSFMLQPSGSN